MTPESCTRQQRGNPCGSQVTGRGEGGGGSAVRENREENRIRSEITLTGSLRRFG